MLTNSDFVVLFNSQEAGSSREKTGVGSPHRKEKT